MTTDTNSYSGAPGSPLAPPPAGGIILVAEPGVFEVRLDLFDGPIDLLLHLVKKNELPIEKLSLAQIAAQYMHCIESMRELDLELAGEYLVIAATLLSIKSSFLLDDPVELVLDDEGNLVDPHEELLRRLREAAVYKDGARYLGGRALLGVDVFEPPSILPSLESPPVKLKQHDPFLLGIAFRKLIDKADSASPLFKISIDSVSIVAVMMRVVDDLRASNGPLSFEKLVGDLTSRGSIISSFLALLELCKRQVIAVSQPELGAEILIALSENSESLETIKSDLLVDGSEFDAEFDATVAVGND